MSACGAVLLFSNFHFRPRQQRSALLLRALYSLRVRPGMCLVDALWGALNPVALARFRLRQRGAGERFDELDLGVPVFELFEAGAAPRAALVCKLALVSF